MHAFETKVMMQRYQVSRTDNARKLDLSRAHMINAFHLQIAALRDSVFYEFVPSKCNVADFIDNTVALSGLVHDATSPTCPPEATPSCSNEVQEGKRTAMNFPLASDWTGPLESRPVDPTPPSSVAVSPASARCSALGPQHKHTQPQQFRASRRW